MLNLWRLIITVKPLRKNCCMSGILYQLTIMVFIALFVRNPEFILIFLPAEAGIRDVSKFELDEDAINMRMSSPNISPVLDTDSIAFTKLVLLNTSGVPEGRRRGRPAPGGASVGAAFLQPNKNNLRWP